MINIASINWSSYQIKIYNQKMNDSQFETFILNKGYKTSNQFNNSPKDLLRLINYVKNLPVKKQSLEVLQNLLKFYRTPLFIACHPFYQKLMKADKQLIIECQQNIRQIANFVKNYLGQYNLQELKFFQFLGVSKKKRKIPQKSQPQKQFMSYIQTLGKHLNKLKKQMNVMGAQKLKLQIDSILAGGLERKLNTLQHFYEQYFKSQADYIYKQNKKKIQQQLTPSEMKKSLQSRPESEQQKKIPLCCRTFFFDDQIIKQPQNLLIQYKNYYIPFGPTQVRILKKTVCAFLNTNGGTIYLGIQENNDTKMRRIIGNQLNQAQKQDLMFTLRKQIIDSIQPDILSNKMYAFSFVPIKHKNYPHQYISGRYVTKISIKYGQRNQIYSYRHEDKDFFAFRTENQVIHRQGRQILNAYRQRLNNPIPIPVPIHQGPCAAPQEGSPIIIDNPRNNYNDFPLPGAVPSQKKKYKQKDAIDFIILKISQTNLIKQIFQQNLKDCIQITPDQVRKTLYIKLLIQQKRTKLIQLLSRLQSQNMCQFYETQRGVQIPQSENMDLILEKIQPYQMKFIPYEKRKTLQFKSTQEAMECFLILRDLGVITSFIKS